MAAGKKARYAPRVKLRALACLFAAALVARAADAPAIPLRDALKRKGLVIGVRGDTWDQATVIVRNSGKEDVELAIPAGLVCVGCSSNVVVLRGATLKVPAQQSAEAVLPVVAFLTSKTPLVEGFVKPAETVPVLDPLLKYAAARNDFPKATAQLVALVLLENVTFARWQEFLAAQRAPDAGPAPTPAEIVTAIDALGVLREIAPERKFALASDDELKVRALRHPLARAKAMQLYGLALPDGIVAPDLQQLLHTKPGDNCPICRMRAQMQESPGGL